MNHPGHIEIKDNEVIFVYHELEEPRIEDYEYGSNKFVTEDYSHHLKEYLASKRSVKVENDYIIDWRKNIYIIIGDSGEIVIKNNQPCEAEVENGKAIITKIL